MPERLSMTTPLSTLFKRCLDRLRVAVEWRLMRATDPLALRLSGARGSSANEVAVVKMDAIGDFVLWLGAAQALRERFRGRRIVLIANAAWASLAEKLPYWDEVWPVDPGRLRRWGRYRAKVLRAVRQRSFDTAVQPACSREFLLGDALIRATAASERIGSQGDLHNISAKAKAISDRWYTCLLPAQPPPVSELERNAEFMQHLLGSAWPPRYPALPELLDLPAKLRPSGPYLIIFPGASAPYRQWPAERFAEVANSLCGDHGLTAVVCGSRGEKALCQRVMDELEVAAMNLAGATSLPEFAELVRGARLLIGNETSSVHIAAAVDVPTVCVLGGGHYGRFMPYDIEVRGQRPTPEPVVHRMACFGCDWQCTQPHAPGGPVPCISGVSVADVLQASVRALAAVGRSAPHAGVPAPLRHRA
jgi:ADP-heptose:LPS heptosyltransferase